MKNESNTELNGDIKQKNRKTEKHKTEKFEPKNIRIDSNEWKGQCRVTLKVYDKGK